MANTEGGRPFRSHRESFREAVRKLIAEAHKNNSPHPHRPDLRGSGMPRKRGKGQS